MRTACYIHNMRRVINFILCLGVLLFMAGCNTCATQPVTPKPESINNYRELLQGQAPVVYKLTGMLEGADSIVFIKRVQFQKSGDTIINGDSLFILQMEVSRWEDGANTVNSVFYVSLSDEGAYFSPPEGEGAIRFFTLKTGAVSGAPTGFYQTLPHLLLSGTHWAQANGSFEFQRQISGLDTLEFQEKLQESWVVEEAALYGEQTIMSARYWYGVSGLIRSEQRWGSFDSRDAFGIELATGAFVRLFEMQ